MALPMAQMAMAGQAAVQAGRLISIKTMKATRVAAAVAGYSHPCAGMPKGTSEQEVTAGRLVRQAVPQRTLRLVLVAVAGVLTAALSGKQGQQQAGRFFATAIR